MDFALIGIGGYIAPRHLQAIKATGHRLVATYDPNDSVGVLDQYFPEAAYFTEFERFDRHLEKIKRQGNPVDFLVICSPNYLHDAHARFGLRYGAHVICEKPLVLNPWNLAPLEEMEQETGKKVWNILQMRLHAQVAPLKALINADPSHIWDVTLTYITPRGPWYHASWKGDAQKSGGVATNIGIHLLDLLIWLFGSCVQQEVHVSTHDRAGGYLQLEKARVKWFLSTDAATLPPDAPAGPYRQLTIGTHTFDFSQQFTDLHILSYQEILAGQGFGIGDAAPAIDLAYQIRKSTPIYNADTAHPFSALTGKQHPFAHDGQ